MLTFCKQGLASLAYAGQAWAVPMGSKVMVSTTFMFRLKPK